MKITIDTNTTPHTIEVHGKSTLGELIEFLSKYYPDFTWKDVAVGEKSMLQFGSTQQTWAPQQLWHSQQYGTGATGIITLGSTGSYTSAVRDSKSAVDLFDVSDVMAKPAK